MTAYKLIKARFEHPAGTICYLCRDHDYGCANDDTRTTGVEHWSMTLSPEGKYPFFTVPVTDLEETS